MAASSTDGVVLLTGGTSGIGRQAADLLVERGMEVVIVGRDRERGERVARESSADADGTVHFHRADLASQSAVRDLAEAVCETYDRLDVLAHNAGLAVRERTETPDGIETTFAVNHLAPYLLTHELLDRLRESAPARIVVTSSGIHSRGTLDFEDLQFERGYDDLDAYARSKLANVAFTVELASRLEDVEEQVTANCFHPGFIPSTRLFRSTSAWRRAALRVLGAIPGIGTTQEEGARRLVRLATASEFASKSGEYVGGKGVASPADEATDPAVRRRLWEVSADLVDVDPAWP